MLIPVCIQSVGYKIKVWKRILIAVLLTVSGTIGTYVLFFIENGWIGGTSFFGAVFLVPILFLFIPKLLRVPYGDLMDLCAPAECVMLAVMKVQCLIGGCCDGRALFVSSNGTVVCFPSQIAELINALIIMGILMAMSRKEQFRGKLYPWYMVIYGTTRFVLNLFRGDTTPFALGLPAGNVWSLLAIAIGVVWLAVLRRKNITDEASPEGKV